MMNHQYYHNIMFKLDYMKNLLFIISILSFNTLAYGQLEESSKSMSTGVNNAIILDIPNSEAKIVEKVWKNYSKNFNTKTKKDKKSDEWSSISPLLSGFNDQVDNLIVRIEESGENTKLISWFEVEGDYLNSSSNPEDFDAAQVMLMGFALEVAKEYTMMEMEEEEKVLKKMESNLKKLKREKENYEKNIVDYEKKILETEKKIEDNIFEQEKSKLDIETQLEVIEMVRQKLSELDN